VQLLAHEAVGKYPSLGLERVGVAPVLSHIAFAAAARASTTIEFGYAVRGRLGLFLRVLLSFGAWISAPQQHLFRCIAKGRREWLQVIKSQSNYPVLEARQLLFGDTGTTDELRAAHPSGLPGMEKAGVL
jgi:hypothetical protein